MWVLVVLMLVGPDMDIPIRITYETPVQSVCEDARNQILSISPQSGARVVGVGSCERRVAL